MGTTTTTYCYDQADRLTSATGVASVTYDDRGNTTAVGDQAYGWDVADRYISTTTPTGTTTLTRDPLDGVNGKTTVANPYAYVYNSPANGTDPTGRQCGDGCFGNGGVGGGGFGGIGGGIGDGGFGGIGGGGMGGSGFDAQGPSAGDGGCSASDSTPPSPSTPGSTSGCEPRNNDTVPKPSQIVFGASWITDWATLSPGLTERIASATGGWWGALIGPT